ncbi:MAG: hypothetical protein Q8Q09_28755 [Deltaproteobacteria bacterium]|nr:hypothetical protein [Deltaproteobacteria bacterium]
MTDPVSVHRRQHNWRLLLGACLFAIACGGPGRPDVLAFEPVLEEDNRLVTLLDESTTLAVRDRPSAVRDIRTVVLGRAQANAAACGNLQVIHPTAVALRTRLCGNTVEREESTRALMLALEAGDATGVSSAIRRMIALARAMDQLEADVQRARNQQPTSGCARRG